MKKCLLCLLAAFFIAFGVVGDSQAIPLPLNESGISGNSWDDGERYTFLAGTVDLSPGQYDLTFNVQGIVWAEGVGVHGWEWKDKIIIEAYLDDSLIGSKTAGGWDGQRTPFDVSLSLDFDTATDKLLKIDVYSDVTHSSEQWRLGNASLSGAFEENPAPAHTPEPATMLLFGSGLLGLAGLKRKIRTR